VFGRLQQVREQRTQLKLLVRRARLFTPDVADKVATLARSNPDGALEAFVSAFQRAHFELDEGICEQGFDFWADAAGEFIPLLVRGTDRCNGIDPLGYRPGYALQWALIQDVFNDDERHQVIAEVAETFGKALADRLEAAEPPAHHSSVGAWPVRDTSAWSRSAAGHSATSRPRTTSSTSTPITQTSLSFRGPIAALPAPRG
jgi:hypothetical protein